VTTYLEDFEHDYEAWRECAPESGCPACHGEARWYACIGASGAGYLGLISVRDTCEASESPQSVAAVLDRAREIADGGAVWVVRVATREVAP
jgi:hypothetical protein